MNTVKAPKFPLPRGHFFGWKSEPSADLMRWQQRMKDRGWAIKVDGIYGRQTAEIAYCFQEEKSLKPDGKIGQATWYAAWTAPIT